jgi:hypothetical protein
MRSIFSLRSASLSDASGDDMKAILDRLRLVKLRKLIMKID